MVLKETKSCKNNNRSDDKICKDTENIKYNIMINISFNVLALNFTNEVAEFKVNSSLSKSFDKILKGYNLLQINISSGKTQRKKINKTSCNLIG